MRPIVLAAALCLLAYAPADAARRCMAEAHIRTIDTADKRILKDGDPAGPIAYIWIKSDSDVFLCEGRTHLCFPAGDLDMVTTCAVNFARRSEGRVYLK